MNDLEKYFKENTGGVIHKWNHYLEVYDRYFSKFRGREVHIVEFGVSQGGSLQMWKHYFGEKAKIYGVDINPQCKRLEEDRIRIFIGDQGNRSFLKSVLEQIPRIDILIDDGGHSMQQQINTFEIFFPAIDSSGIYLCEDMHTSYWPKYGGGYKREGTFIEFTKDFIDHINAWHSEEKDIFDINDFTRSVYSLHYYDSMIVIEKRPIDKPSHTSIGNPKILNETFFHHVRMWLIKKTNRLKNLFRN